MKNIFYVYLFFLTALNIVCQSKNLKKNSTKKDTSVFEKLSKIDFNYLIGKPFSNYLQNDTLKKYKEYHLNIVNPAALGGVYLLYSDNVAVTVYFQDIRFQNALALPENWNFKLLSKEKISQIRLSYGQKVIFYPNIE